LKGEIVEDGSREIEALPFVTTSSYDFVVLKKARLLPVVSSMTGRPYGIVVDTSTAKDGRICGVISIVNGRHRLKKSEWVEVLLGPSDDGRRLVVSALT